MGRRSKFSPEVRERAVRLVAESPSTHGSKWRRARQPQEHEPARDPKPAENKPEQPTSPPQLGR
jgi:transposase-like protein